MATRQNLLILILLLEGIFQLEFNQMFYEAWAQMEENYYDERFHGLDWLKTKARYKQYLPYLNTRVISAHCSMICWES
ncbi:MAG: hypothetical protein IPP42_05280 [Saprospiraceae bacterium]|nr:hypothetical protein [Saprospiraceae bacterium]